jgi:hypothetical protein
MFPLSAEKLRLFEIADFWSRDIKPSASKKELLAKLEAAWWLGEITGNSARTRLQFLKQIFKSRREPYMQSVVFVSPDDDGPTISPPLVSGEVIVDLTPRITVPFDGDDWTESSCAAAFQKLATLPSCEYFPELGLGLYFIELTPEEFFGWVIKRGFDVPGFWKRTIEIGVTETTRRDFASGANFGGRPEEYDWEKIKSYVLGLVKENGVPSKDNKKLPTLQALIEVICIEWAKKDIHLPHSTIRPHLRKWLNEMRRA